MKNLIIGLTVLTISSLANAVPNSWTSFERQGYKIYKIDDNKGKSLRIFCNYASSDDLDHGVYLTINNQDYPNPSSPYPLRLEINDSIDILGFENTKSKSESKKWYTFTSAITKAKSITIYIENQLVSVIYPKNPATVKNLAKCNQCLIALKLEVDQI